MDLTGAVIEKAGSLCAAGALVGMFSQSGARDETGEAINLISAPAFAAEREIEVSRTVNSSPGAVYASLLRLTIQTAHGTHTIAGTVFGPHQLRVVEFDGHCVEFVPSGYIFIYKSIDKPGVLHRVCGLMADAHVNIMSATVSSGDTNKNVVNILSIDQKLDKATLDKAAALPDVSEAHCLHLCCP